MGNYLSWMSSLYSNLTVGLQFIGHAVYKNRLIQIVIFMQAHINIHFRKNFCFQSTNCRSKVTDKEHWSEEKITLKQPLKDIYYIYLPTNKYGF